MGTSAEWHEVYEQMSDPGSKLRARCKSMQEELEAVDWYNQRAEVTADEQLGNILLHNRDGGDRACDDDAGIFATDQSSLP